MSLIEKLFSALVKTPQTKPPQTVNIKSSITVAQKPTNKPQVELDESDEVVMYAKRHYSGGFGVSPERLMELKAQYPKGKTGDLMWGEFNRLKSEMLATMNFKFFPLLCDEMAEFLHFEGKTDRALDVMLSGIAESKALGCDWFPEALTPRQVKRIRFWSKKTKVENLREKMIEVFSVSYNKPEELADICLHTIEIADPKTGKMRLSE